MSRCTVSRVLDRLILDAIGVGCCAQVLVLAQKGCDLSFELLSHLTVDIDVLDGERDDRATDLHGHRMVFCQAQGIF